MSKAARKYEEFQGFGPDHVSDVEVPVLESLVFLGKAVAVEYECEKKNGGGDGSNAIYRHEFHQDDILCCDPSGKMLVVIGPKLRVEDRGIVN